MTNQERRARMRTRIELCKRRGHVGVHSAVGVVLDRKVECQFAGISNSLCAISDSLGVLRRRALAEATRSWWSRLFGRVEVKPVSRTPETGRQRARVAHFGAAAASAEAGDPKSYANVAQQHVEDKMRAFYEAYDAARAEAPRSKT